MGRSIIMPSDAMWDAIGLQLFAIRREGGRQVCTGCGTSSEDMAYLKVQPDRFVYGHWFCCSVLRRHFEKTGISPIPLRWVVGVDVAEASA